MTSCEIDKELLLDILGSLNAAISLLEAGSKEAAPSDKMFDHMISDYKASLERGISVYKTLKED